MLTAGIDIGGTSIKLGLFDRAQGLHHLEKQPTPRGNVREVAALIADYAARMGAKRIGIGTAGTVDSRSRTVTASNLGWRSAPLQALVQSLSGCSVVVENDAHAALMAECYDGACVGVRDAVLLTLGTGVGSALLLDGKLWRGRFHMGGELGHMITHVNGEPCACGRRGCFEMYASAAALARRLPGFSSKDIVEGVTEGNPLCREAFARYIDELTAGLISINMIFMPEVIVLGGGLSRSGELLRGAADRMLTRAFQRHPEDLNCRLALARHLNDAGMLGAALLAEEAFPEVPA